MHRQAAGSDVFRAIADPTRRAILARLRQGPAPVNTLAAEFAQSRPAISKHLRVLHHAKVVSEHRSGRERIYRIEPATLRAVDDWIGDYRNLWQDNLNRLKAYLEET
jgi:DNA-binding transcriptional ArsR family regulator